MPLHATSARIARTRAAIILSATCVAAGGVAIAVSDGQPAAADHAIAETSQPTISRYDDLAANKTRSMRALGLAMMRRQSFRSPYRDLEANKAQSRRAR